MPAAISMAQWVKKLQIYKQRFDEAKARGMEQAGKEIVPILRERSIRAGFATGDFAAGWYSTRRGAMVHIGNNRVGAGFIEYGRRPGKAPPIQAIVRWVEIKFRVGGPEAVRRAFAISRKIAVQGVKGKNILKSASPQMKIIVLKNVAKAVWEEWKRA